MKKRTLADLTLNTKYFASLFSLSILSLTLTSGPIAFAASRFKKYRFQTWKRMEIFYLVKLTILRKKRVFFWRIISITFKQMAGSKR